MVEVDPLHAPEVAPGVAPGGGVIGGGAPVGAQVQAQPLEDMFDITAAVQDISVNRIILSYSSGGCSI